MDLFEEKKLLPLSKRMMPETIDDFVGQKHLIGEGKPIRIMLVNRIIHSMIFYGPPATGKTSLAEIIAKSMDYNFVKTNALTLDNEDIRLIIKNARNSDKKTILFIDEIHRLNKPKQDIFLSELEYGELIIIGATTENPYFVLNPALRSRVFIYEFYPLNSEEKRKILENAIKKDEFLRKVDLSLSDEAINYLINSSGDVRQMLNLFEMAILSKGVVEKINIDLKDLEDILQKKETKYSSEEGHYDVISAFIKSVRGSDPDASLYYLALMIQSGEDPLFIARRLIILAAEDIGLAYPEALNVAVSCYEAIERIGMPEGRIVLGMTTLFLVGLPKSNSAYLAIDKA
ncbi:MAG: replication-associated recombination protein A, partial [Brevinematales bacterium]|nr:replication-associated recombination protein A [Brevinematales bacterium]